MPDAGCVFDGGHLAGCQLLRRNNLVIERVDPSGFPCLQYQLMGECLEVCRTKCLCEVILCDSAVVFLFKQSNFFGPVVFQWCKAYNIKALEEVCAV